jgi:hypothetical protein
VLQCLGTLQQRLHITQPRTIAHDRMQARAYTSESANAESMACSVHSLKAPALADAQPCPAFESQGLLSHANA